MCLDRAVAHLGLGPYPDLPPGLPGLPGCWDCSGSSEVPAPFLWKLLNPQWLPFPPSDPTRTLLSCLSVRVTSSKPLRPPRTLPGGKGREWQTQGVSKFHGGQGARRGPLFLFLFLRAQVRDKRVFCMAARCLVTKLQRKSNVHSICMYVNIPNVNKWIVQSTSYPTYGFRVEF